MDEAKMTGLSMNHLKQSFYSHPDAASQVMTKKQLSGTIRETGGMVLTKKGVYQVSGRPLGDDLFKVRLIKKGDVG